jgi:hypothetical protein
MRSLFPGIKQMGNLITGSLAVFELSNRSNKKSVQQKRGNK